jgi:hypothetical protein
MYCLTKAGFAPDAFNQSGTDPHPLKALLQWSLKRRLDAAGKELRNFSSFRLWSELIMKNRHVRNFKYWMRIWRVKINVLQHTGETMELMKSDISELDGQVFNT